MPASAVLEVAVVLIPARRALANRTERAPRKGNNSIRDTAAFDWQIDMALTPLCDNRSSTAHGALLVAAAAVPSFSHPREFNTSFGGVICGLV